MRIVVFALALGAAIIVSGCRPSYDIVGGWKGVANTPQGHADQHIDFEANHQFTSKTFIHDENGHGFQMVDSGRWTLEGDQLTFEFLDSVASVPGNKTPAAEQFAASINAQRDEQLRQLNAKGKVTIRWIDEDHFVEISQDGEQPFERD